MRIRIFLKLQICLHLAHKEILNRIVRYLQCSYDGMNVFHTFNLTSEISTVMSNGSSMSVNPLTTNVPDRIETNQLICNANQLTGFCMMRNIGP